MPDQTPGDNRLILPNHVTTPAAPRPVTLPDRHNLARTIYAEGAYCGDCEYAGWETCPACRRVCIDYADVAIEAFKQVNP